MCWEGKLDLGVKMPEVEFKSIFYRSGREKKILFTYFRPRYQTFIFALCVCAHKN